MAETLRTPDRVQIFDTTLRDGAQSPGIALTLKQSLAIANQLNKLGVDVIEAGFPNSSVGNFEAVQAIAREVEGPVIAGLARAQADDIARTSEAVIGAASPRIHTFLSTSDIHMEAQRTNRTQTKEQTKASVAHAKSLVDDVEFSPMDASRSDIEFTAEVIDIAIAEGATVINIPDTVGYSTPEEYAEQLKQLQELVPAIGGVILSVHCHNDLGLAVANSVAGVQAGARQVEVAVNGIGERAGNTSLEEFVMLLNTRADRYNLATGIDTKAIGPTSRMVSRYTGYVVQRNKAVVGANAFQHEAGIHQNGVLTDRQTFEIMSSESVGMKTDGIVLGRQSGRKAIKHVLENEGGFRPEYIKPTFKLFKEIADEIGGITTEQMVAIQDEAERLTASEFMLTDFETAKDRAHVELVDSSGNSLFGIVVKRDLFGGEDDKNIDGTTSALFSAIRKATGTNYPLETFKTESIGKGENALALAHVELRINGKTVSSKGLSTDTSEASAKAYLSALTKAMRSDEQEHSESIVQV